MIFFFQDWKYYVDKLNISTGYTGWALKMFDASGKLPGTGVLEGSFASLPGNVNSCLEVAASTFRGQWCNFYIYSLQTNNNEILKERLGNVGQLNYGQVLQLLETKNTRDIFSQILSALTQLGNVQTGQCVPDSCTGEEMMAIYNQLLNPQHAGAYFAEGATFCKRNDDAIELSSSDWAVIALIAFFATLILIGTITDLYLRHWSIAEKYQEHTFVVVFQGFSLYLLFQKIFHVSENKDNLGCINGIRFLSMAWVIIGHTYFLILSTPPYLANNAVIVNFLESYGMRTIFNATPSVDSFFLIGAVLLSYLTLQQLEKQNGGSVKFWVMFYVHRYIRLTGVYAVAIAIHATILRHLTTNQSQIFEGVRYTCKDDWWTNILYINNFKEFLNTNDCMGHTWYMANDMQMFLVSPFFIYAMYKVPLIGVTFTSLVVIASTSYRAWWYSEEQEHIADSNDMYSKELADFDYVYDKPWTRVAPYATGLLVGWLLHFTKGKKIPKSWVNISIAIFINFCAILTLYLVVYGHDPQSQEENFKNITYKTLFRTAWGIGLGLIIVTCAKVTLKLNCLLILLIIKGEKLNGKNTLTSALVGE